MFFLINNQKNFNIFFIISITILLILITRKKNKEKMENHNNMKTKISLQNLENFSKNIYNIYLQNQEMSSFTRDFLDEETKNYYMKYNFLVDNFTNVKTLNSQNNYGYTSSFDNEINNNIEALNTYTDSIFKNVVNNDDKFNAFKGLKDEKIAPKKITLPQKSVSIKEEDCDFWCQLGKSMTSNPVAMV